VAACEKLGFQSALDVRWYRMSHFIKGQREKSGFHPWLWLFGMTPPPKTPCTCGQPLPLMECRTFTFVSEKKAHYLLGQCCRCLTMFWEEVSITTGP
jgi:hypothetical protein